MRTRGEQSSMDYETIEVKNNPEAHRYEANIGEHVAILTYTKRAKHITFLHTEVPTELAHHGIASKLAQAALDDARAQQLTVTPMCPFVASYIRHHQEYLSLVSE